MNIHGVLETCLYAEDLEPVEIFYTKVLKFEVVTKEVNRHLFFRCGSGMLLIFNPEYTSGNQTYVNGSPIPLHGTTGAGHLALSVNERDLDVWKKQLTDHHVEIESEVEWPGGYHSLYFRDPARNSLELVSPAIWNEKK